MQAALIRPDEATRLLELYRCGILDTATKRAMTDLVFRPLQCADRTFGALSLIDADRPWFKAPHGFCLKQTVRNQSICGHVILTSD